MNVWGKEGKRDIHYSEKTKMSCYWNIINDFVIWWKCKNTLFMGCEMREAHLNVNKISTHTLHSKWPPPHTISYSIVTKIWEIFQQAYFHSLHVAAISVGPSNEQQHWQNCTKIKSLSFYVKLNQLKTELSAGTDRYILYKMHATKWKRQCNRKREEIKYATDSNWCS